MNASRSIPTLDVDPCSLAVVLALLTALVSVADPAFASLTLALVALAAASFLIGLRPRYAGRLPREISIFAAFSILALGGALFFALPAEWSAVRALPLAAAATPLWWLRRHSAASAGWPGGAR